MIYPLGIKKSPYDCRDFKYEALKEVVAYPQTLDLRPKMFDVTNQGNYPTCSAMTARQMKEFQEIKDVGLTESMAAQYVYNLRENYPEDGMAPRDTMRILFYHGIVEERFYPYAKDLSNQVPAKVLERGEKLYKCSGYAYVNTIEGLKQSLFENGVCYLGVPVYNFTPRMWKQRPGDSFLGGHAMAIVGYNDAGFIIRNSWGEGWGENGHTIFPYEDWGLQWEVWTSLDADTVPEPVKKSWLRKLLEKFWNWVVNLFRSKK